MAVWRLEGVSVPEKRFAAKSAQTFRLPLVKCEDEYKKVLLTIHFIDEHISHP